MPNPLSSWRLIRDGALSGAQNMAIDESILKSVGEHRLPPTLRLYRWQPACLSLGYGQPASDADLARLKAHGWDIVRRQTGGRAILHTDEITYSLRLPLDHPLAAGTIVESYRRISAALLQAVQQLGSQPHADARAEKIKGAGPVCFEVPSDYEITVNGKKLIGSAQRRDQTGLLQHGSLPLTGDLSRICEALVFPTEAERHTAKERVLDRAITLESALGHTISWENTAQALQESFQETFQIQFAASGLDYEEQQRAAALITDRYGNPEWTLRI